MEVASCQEVAENSRARAETARAAAERARLDARRAEEAEAGAAAVADTAEQELAEVLIIVEGKVATLMETTSAAEEAEVRPTPTPAPPPPPLSLSLSPGRSPWPGFWHRVNQALWPEPNPTRSLVSTLRVGEGSRGGRRNRPGTGDTLGDANHRPPPRPHLARLPYP